jgi:hypothetical protein
MLINLKEIAEAKKTQLDLVHRDLKKCYRTLGEMCRVHNRQHHEK